MSTPNRFRFRAWDKQKNHMLRVVEIYQSGRLAGAFEHPPASRAEPWSKEPVLSYHIETLPHDRVILMQSTGICDKKGKEIFEGDIILSSWFGEEKDANKYVVCWNAPTFIGISCQYYKELLNHRRAQFGNCITCSVDYMSSTPQHRVLKVIGNIHQNPELLK